MLMILLVADQPLFQRGIRVTTRTREVTKDLTIPNSASPFQTGTTGVIPDHQPPDAPQLFHPLFSKVVQQYQNRDPMKLPDFGCLGSCEFDIVAPGWEATCHEWQTDFHFMDGYELMAWYDHYFNNTDVPYLGPERTQKAFAVNTSYYLHDPKSTDLSTDGSVNYRIDISVMYKATLGANGTMHWHNCTLIDSLVRYPVQVANNTLLPRTSTSDLNRTVHHIWRRTEPTGQNYSPSTLGGIWRALDNQFSAAADIIWSGAWSSIMTNDTASSAYLQTPDGYQLDNYNMTWKDPMNDMISMVDELTLRTAIFTTDKLVVPVGFGKTVVDEAQRSDPALLTQPQADISSPNLTLVNRTVEQNARVSMQYVETVYQTELGWLLGAFSVILLAFLSIIPTYWGWWHLGRSVSLSPLEIAKAFDAPLMRTADSNSNVRDYLRAIGDMKVHYGMNEVILSPAKCSDIEMHSLRPVESAASEASMPVLRPSTLGNNEEFSHSQVHEEIPAQGFEPYNNLAAALGDIFDTQEPAATNGSSWSPGSSIIQTAASLQTSTDHHNSQPSGPDSEACVVRPRLMFRK